MSNKEDDINDLFIFVVSEVPIVKDQSRVAGSANLPSGNTAVSTASMITGENTHTHIDAAANHSRVYLVHKLMIFI